VAGLGIAVEKDYGGPVASDLIVDPDPVHISAAFRERLAGLSCHQKHLSRLTHLDVDAAGIDRALAAAREIFR